MVRRNFGFLYGTMGKSLYIIFIAFLSFGLGDPTVSFIIVSYSNYVYFEVTNIYHWIGLGFVWTIRISDIFEISGIL